jgi:hypothetical protein
VAALCSKCGQQIFSAGGQTDPAIAITLYGRDSTRFDQIYGSEFEYDNKPEM